MNTNFLLTVVFIFLAQHSFSQDTLAVNWHRNVCSNQYIDHVYDIECDSSGNVYTLGTFPNSALSLGQSLHDSTGSYFLNKLDSLGNLVYSINFGNEDHFTFGALEISNGNLIVGASFKGDFHLGGNILTSSSNWSSLIMKLDSNLNVMWFKKIPCVKQTVSPSYLRNMVLDHNQNIYTSIQFIDSLEIDGTIYTSQNGNVYGFVIAKYDSNGINMWTRQYEGEEYKTLSIREMKFYQKDDNLGNIILTGHNNGDTLFIEGVPHLIENGIGAFTSKVDVNGTILESKHFKNIDYIVDFSFFNDRIYCAGKYGDTAFWNGNTTSPSGTKSTFICELDQNSTIIDFRDISSSENLNLTNFTISEHFGFILAGQYSGGMSVQSSSITLSNQYFVGSVIATFDQNFMLNNAKYITGGYYNLRHICLSNDIIYGTGAFENNCSFENISIQTGNDDISVFRSTDIDFLTDFSLSLGETELPNQKILLYPNPTNDVLYIVAEQSIVKAEIIDLFGRTLKVVEGNQIEFMDASDLENGEYLLRLSSENGARILRFVRH